MLGALVAVAMLGGGELALRAAGVPDPGLYEGDPAWLWYLRPELDRVVPGPSGDFRVQTTAEGLRGPSPPSNGPWTLVLGCSTTFGWGVEAEEAWPARLARLSDLAVVNGGVPGWSTAQAVRGAGRWLDAGPTEVILAFGVRDAWPASRSDVEARPTHPLLLSQLGRLLRSLTHGERSAAPSRGRVADAGAFRVPPAAFAENTRRLVARAGDAEVHLLWFPQQEARTPWRRALEAVGPVIAPTLDPVDYFTDDPVHLTPSGHARLAVAVADALSAAAAPAPEGKPPGLR